LIVYLVLVVLGEGGSIYRHASSAVKRRFVDADMEKYQGKITTNESDMGVFDKNAVLIVCSAGGHSVVAMERS
jgi:hypothetical protein